MYRDYRAQNEEKAIDSVFCVSSNKITLGESMDTNEKHLLTYSTNYLYKETDKYPFSDNYYLQQPSNPPKEQPSSFCLLTIPPPLSYSPLLSIVNICSPEFTKFFVP
jgi:hypothetical protein